MQKKFITNLGLLLFLNFLIKPFWLFGIDRTVQNVVSAEEYGTYFALFNFSVLFNIVLDFGITNFNNRNISQHKQLLSKYFSGIVVFKFLLAVIYLIITFTAGYVVGYDNDRFYMLLFLSINQFLISFIQYLRSNIAGLQLHGLNSLLSVLDKSIIIIFCAVLLWGNIFDATFKLMHFVYAQTLAYIVTSIIVFGIVLAKTKSFKLKLNKAFSLLILKQTYPYAVLVLAMTFYYRIDAVMLDSMLVDGEVQAAIYAQGYRLMDAASQIGVLFATLLLPMFANMIQNNKKVVNLVKLSFSLIFVPSIILAVACFFFSEEITSTLYLGSTASSNVLGVLMFCFVAIAATYIFGTLLTANGSLKTLNQLAIGGMVLNVVLNLILIPVYKAEGSAVASLITQFIVVLVQIIVVKKVFSFNVNYKFIATILLYILLILALVIGVQNYILSFPIQFMVFVFVSGILALFMRIIDLKKMVQIFTNK
ncbi:MAG: oligosaccharide flippase family protein [Vicingaceae bacterium]|nr:oligosaccharide flippase family protein [Vicingaceae bacterium]